VTFEYQTLINRFHVTGSQPRKKQVLVFCGRVLTWFQCIWQWLRAGSGTPGAANDRSPMHCHWPSPTNWKGQLHRMFWGPLVLLGTLFFLFVHWVSLCEPSLSEKVWNSGLSLAWRVTGGVQADPLKSQAQCAVDLEYIISTVTRDRRVCAKGQKI
jgi:hypothetical protein